MRVNGSTQAPPTLKEILVPVDFSPRSCKALEYAVAFADQFGSRITLIHVVEPVVAPEFTALLVGERDQAMKTARGQLYLLCKHQEIPRRLIGGTLVRYGAPVQEISEAARGLKADLMIIGTHGYSGLKHALIGSTTEHVVRHAPCPVLVVREREHDFLAPQPTARPNRV
jgi:nucleotide-binding universal stress UspA family protein